MVWETWSKLVETSETYCFVGFICFFGFLKVFLLFCTKPIVLLSKTNIFVVSGEHNANLSKDFLKFGTCQTKTIVLLKTFNFAWSMALENMCFGFSLWFLGCIDQWLKQESSIFNIESTIKMF